VKTKRDLGFRNKIKILSKKIIKLLYDDSFLYFLLLFNILKKKMIIV
jgi:hypothetical protein